MHVRRLAIALTTAAALTAAGAPAARADISFLVMPGFASAETDGGGTKLELIRGGAVIAASDEGALVVDELKPGDVARAYNEDGTPAGSATYDGTPAIAGACVGSASFTASHGAATLQFAGAFTSSAFEPLVGTWDEAQPARVTLTRALEDGDIAFAAVGRDDVDPPFSSMRMEPAVACSTAPGGTPGTRSAGDDAEAEDARRRPARVGRSPGQGEAARADRAARQAPRTRPDRAARARQGPHARSRQDQHVEGHAQGHAGRPHAAQARGEGDAGRDVHAFARRGQAPAREREGDPQGFVVESVNVSVLAYVPVRSGSFAAIATPTSSTRRLGSRSALSPGPAPVRPQSPG